MERSYQAAMLINDSRVKRDKTFTTTFKHVKPIAYTRSNYVRTKLIVVDSRQIRLCRNFLKEDGAYF